MEVLFDSVTYMGDWGRGMGGRISDPAGEWLRTPQQKRIRRRI